MRYSPDAGCIEGVCVQFGAPPIEIDGKVDAEQGAIQSISCAVGSVAVDAATSPFFENGFANFVAGERAPLVFDAGNLRVLEKLGVEKAGVLRRVG